MRADLERLAQRRPPLRDPSDKFEVDPVTAEVIRSTMETICVEMAFYVSRTAITPILNQSNERNASILDRNGRLAALSVGVPQLMLCSSLPVRFALEFFGETGMNEGDVILSNDPYVGAGHLPDYNVFSPVFADGRLVLIASIQCHQGDTGGSVPGGYNISADDIWGDGVRWPVIKLMDRGVERKDTLLCVEANSRLASFAGDIRAQMGAARLGAARLGELFERYGVDTVEASVDWFIDSTGRAVRDIVRTWPNGVNEADAYVDQDPRGNKDVHIHVKATVDDDHLSFDFTGTDTRENLQAWSAFGNARGFTVAQVAAMIDPSIPKNEGFFDAIDITIPLGCVLNPYHGRPVSAGTHHPGTEVGDAIALALNHVSPERAVPQTYKTGIPTTIVGIDPRTNEEFVDPSTEVYAGWCNAAKGVDAWGALNASYGNLWKAPAEMNENTYPHILWSRDYRTDSGGAGQWRGLCGSHYVKEVRVPSRVYTRVVGIRYPMPGIAGGNPGSPNSLTLAANSEHPVTVEDMADWVQMDAGDRIVYDYGGGGGWGDPLDRDPHAVLDDVLDEYVSELGALRDYGVVLRGSLEDLTLVVDDDATAREREKRRNDRANGRGDGRTNDRANDLSATAKIDAQT
jgi:N-methylhydantoinase B